MSATITSNSKVIAVCYTKEKIRDAVNNCTGRGFELIVDGQEAEIIREAMRRYCEPPSKAEEILAAITPEGCELLPELIHAPDDPKACISLHPDLHVRVKIRKLGPPVEYRYECEAEPREARIGDWIRSDDKWVEVKEFGFLRKPQLCYRRVEVKR